MKHFSTLALVLFATSASAQLTVTDSLSSASIAQLLAGLNVEISNVQVNCANSAMGHFSGTSEMEITEGLVLTSGQADLVAYPVGMFASAYVGAPGDADLNFSLAGTGGITQDACVLEFDCTPLGDTLLFNFSFGSEEYLDFVGSSFNDVFAIYLTGPGYPFPTNVAALPDGTPVSINNVNNGINSNYFYNNEAGNGLYVAYDGFTTNLTAFAVVSPEEDYHFKVAVADVSDGVFDSGVFLEAFSFRSELGMTTGIDEALLCVQCTNYGWVATVPHNNVGDELVVTDAKGSVVQRERISSERLDLDLGGLGQGLYVVRVLGDNTLRPVRIVKE